ncbi:hypothetical protein JL475_00075 [Streptomyces sp. M2CJ-2]|uniref:hypothetical protein n=1 Tax=Streptomyces sp. M2CJ-2 TaxID=2803948 RepID=UPI00192485E5|nr:hypothetical protein [Streptomyces sp. M2CJ-2]MBL3664441.1 hypothetical protein [Streptomyces sp. M2CJ-2]
MNAYPEVTAWLVKKAREFRADGSREGRVQADTAAVLASKISRGAVRPNNLLMLPDPGFFEAGRTYQSSRHANLRFECLAISVDPATRETLAVGWRFGPPEDQGARSHEIAALDAADWACCGWTDHYDKVPDPADGCHWCACGNRWPCKQAEVAS